MRRAIIGLCLAVLASAPGAVWAQTLAVTATGALTETDEDFQPGAYTVTRTGAEFASETTIMLVYTGAATVATAAGEGVDIIAPASVTFAAGEDMQTFQITVVGDDLNEPAEVFNIQTSGGGSGITHSGPIPVSIADDDPIVITLSGGGRDNILNEDEFGSNPPVLMLDFGATLTRQLTVRILLGQDSDPATNDVTIVNDPADVGINWLPSSAPRYLVSQIGRPAFQFAAGASTGRITLPLAGDNINEGEDVLVVVIDPDDQSSLGLNNPVSGHHGEVSVVNDFYPFIIGKSDPATVSISAVSTTVSEGQVAEFTVALSNRTQGVITVPYTATGGVSGNTVFSGGFQGTTSPTQATISLLVPVDASRTSGTSDFTVTLGALTADSAAGDVSLAAAPANSASVTVNHRAVAHTFEITGATSIAEGDSATTYAINRTGPAITAGEDLVISWGYAAAAPAPAAADFAGGAAPGGGTATFTGNELSKSFTIGAADDDWNEPVENFVLSLSATPEELASEGGVAFAAAFFAVGITDNDPTIVTIARDPGTPASVGEADSATFNISASGGMRRVRTFTINILDVGFSLSGLERSQYSYPFLDLTTTSDFLQFVQAGDETHSATIDLIDDELNEADRTFTFTGGSTRFIVAAGGVVSYATGAGSASVTVTDDDLITVGIARHADTPAMVNEGGTAVFTVTLDHASAGAVTVNYAASGTTDAPADADSGSIEIPAGSTSGEIALTIPLSNALGADDASETLAVTLSSASVTAAGKGPVTASASVQVMVNYLDAAHILVFDNPATTLVEGAAATTYTVRRNGADLAAGASIAVRWTYAAGATDPAAAADFVGGVAPAGGMLTFTGAQTSATFSIAVAEDAESEPDETFTLGLSAEDSVLMSNGGVALPADIAVVIAASDRPVTLSVAEPIGALVEGGAAAEFAVSFAEMVTTTEAVMVDWAVSFPAASDSVVPAEAADIAEGTRSGTATIPAGESTANISITAADDMLNESAETFSVVLSNPRGGGAIAAPVLHETPSVEAEIAASDSVTVRIAGPGAAVSEGGTADFTLSLALSDGTAAVSAADLCVAFTTAVSQQNSAGSPNTAGNADIAVSDDCDGDAVSVDADGVASGSLNIPAGSESATLSIPVRFDNLDEGATNEVLTITLTGITPAAGAGMATPASAPNDSASVDLMNVSALRSLSVAATTASAEEGGDLVFEVTVNGAAVTTAFDVAWSLAGTATAGEDYSGAASGMVNFGISSDATQTRTLTFGVTDDTDSEDAETLVLTLTDPCAGMTVCSAGGLPGGTPDTVPTLQLTGATATGTIAESDRPIALSVAAPGSVLTEGAAASFAVSFAEAITTTGAVEVDWALEFAAASDSVVPAAAADFATTTGTVEIPAGARTANISITAAADMLNESAETFSIRLSNPRGGGAIAAPALSATSTAEASIAASDPVTIRIAGPGAAVSEGGTADFTLNLAPSGVTSGAALCVQFSTAVSQQSSADGANTAANADIAVRDDCTGDTGAAVAVAADGSANGVFRFPAGSGSATLPILVLFDNLDEGATPETLTVTLTGITPAAGAGMAGVAATPGDSASAQLMNVNALRTLSVSATTASAAEGGGNLVFTATLNGAPVTEAFGVAWSLAGSAEAADYTGAASGTLTFGVSGERLQTQTLTFGAVDDALNEGAEMLMLSLDDPCTSDPCNTGGRPASAGTAAPTLLLANATATATIAASDPITVFITEEPSQTTLARGIGGVSQRTFVPGDSVTYLLSFGTTTVSGSVVQIVTTTHLTIPLILTNAASGATTDINVPVQPGAQSVTRVVSAAMLATLAGTSGTPQISPSVGTVVVADASGNALSGPSAPVAQAGTAADLRAQPDSADSLSPPDPAPGAPDSSVNPAPRRYTQWDMTVAPQESAAQAPEGASYTVTFSLRGNAADLSARGLAFTWQIAARAAAVGGEEADAEDFAFSTAAGCTESTTIAGACGNFPSGEVVFNADDASQTLSIAIFDDGVPEGTTPEGFELSFGTIAGADVGRATLAGEPAGSSSPAALQVDIPALRAFLGIEDAMGQEGGVARFALTLGDFSGGAATTEAVVVEYAVGATGDTADRGADYASAETGRIEIPAGEIAGQGSTAIEIPLLLDGRLEPRERFTVTITSVTGGGGSIDLADSSAVGTIGDDADQAERRGERVGALVTLLDRQTAFLATDAISARFSRHQTAAPPAQLSIANRNLLAASKSPAANGGSAARIARNGAEASAGAAQGAAPDIGLALYGAGGMSGAAATGGASLRGGHAGGYAGGGAGSVDAFGGLGAGLAGGANMGSRTALPNLAQLLQGSRFTFAAANWTSGLSNITDGLQFWGSGGFADIDGDPQSGGDGLSYDGDNFAFFAGADRPVGQNLLAGFALGWAAGDLDFTDRDGAFQMQGTLSNDTISVHPYLGWQVTPTLNAWLVLGFGFGSVDISENEGSGAGRISRALNGGDSTMLMFSAGFSEHRHFAAADLKLRFAVTRVRSDVDSARFDDGALLPSARGRSIRVGGEAELSRRFAFANGIALRPFGSLRARLDSTGSTDAAARREIEGAFDWGAGLQADWPALGLDGRFAFTRQLNETGRDEQRISATVNFDPGAKDRGLSVAVQSALAQSRNHTLGSAFGAGASANSAFGNTFGAGAGGAFGASASSALGAGANGALGGGAGATQSLSGEIAYGMAFRLRQIGRSGLLTPYARFALGHANTRWAAGLRLAEPRSALQVGLEAALDRNSANSTGTTTTTPGSSYDLLLTGQLRF